MVAASDRCVIGFSLSPGQAGDAPEGRALLDGLRPLPALSLGFTPVVSPKSTRIESWEYNKVLYKRRNEVERPFRRLKGFRRIFSRFEKLDLVFVAFIYFALIVEGLR